jgi:putative spermidine/putrescine transport system permease protein
VDGVTASPAPARQPKASAPHLAGARPSTRGRRILDAVCLALYVFLLAPTVIVVLAALNAGKFLTFPPEGLSFRWFANFANSEPFMRAFGFSLKLALWAMATSTILGTLAALYIVRHAGARFRNFLRVYMVTPLQFPAILTGVALLIYFYAIGFDTRGVPALLIGHTVVCLPYVFLMVSSVLLTFDRSVEEAARSLGASPGKTFRRVTFPLIKGSMISGAMFAFIISFDQFAVSLLLVSVGNTTLPIQLYDYLRFAFDPTAAAASSVTILIAVVMVVLLERFVGLETVYWSGPR